uniref:Probable molybdopterin-synthase adenylyltransferase n=1 Tax=Plumaria plumosa TaxID=189642 RepID=A0A4D6WWQ4_9FLOR|nr:Molybdopterin biosynthesis protein [Plumaria plumosa]
MLNPNLKKINLREEEYTIYARHLILENIGINGQKRLKSSKILIIGAGGLGCPAILYLAALGIGYIGIIDEDRINRSNLSRQILFNQENNNQLKTICAKQRIQKINPQCKIITHSYKLTEYNAFEIIKYYNIIIDASDNFKTRYIINYTCYQLHKIHIYGGIQQFEGQISVFNYKSGPRYSDIYPKILNLKDFSCNLNGVLGIITGTIGILQATEAIKIILGVGKILHQDLLIYNSLYSSFKLIKVNSLKMNDIKR